jgi:serine/threonine protein kinase
MSADRNLLFGILALQMDFIRQDDLVQAMHAWVMAKHLSLGHILADKGRLSADRLQLLEALVAEHLKGHQDDPQQSLAALSSASSICRSLGSVADGDVQASLAQVGAVSELPSTIDQTKPPDDGLRYHILRPHAAGGLGEVFVAEDGELHREVALKQIKCQHAHDEHSRARFVLEAEITGGLEHPGIVPVYGLGQYGDGRPFYAMRFIKGDNLQAAISRFHKADVAGWDAGERSLAFRQLLRRFIDVCNAIAYAHSRGVLHRDLKPGNIMLGKYGETLVVDWGLAKTSGAWRVAGGANGEQMEQTLRPSSGSGVAETQAGSVIGTPAFMSPEQASGQVDQLGPASDIYGLGATLYVVLTGQAPFRDEELAGLLEKVRRGDLESPRRVKPSTPAALEAICLKAMALKPMDRYATALDLAADVEHWLADEPVAAYPEPWHLPARRWMRRHRTLVTSVMATAVMAAVGLWVALAIRAAADRREAESRRRETEARTAEAESYERQGISDSERGRKEEALTWFGKSQDKLRSLDLTDRAHRVRLARVAYNLAALNRDTGRFDRARQDYLEAIDSYQALVAEDPRVAEMVSDLGNAYGSRGDMLQLSGQFKEALRDYELAFAFHQKAIVLAPEAVTLRLHLAQLYDSRAVVYERLGDLRAMEEDLQECRKLLDAVREPIAAQNNRGLERTARRLLALAQQNHGNLDVRKLLALAPQNHGNLDARKQQFKKALMEYAKAEQLTEALCADEPGQLEYELLAAKCGFNAGFVQYLLDDLNGAEISLAKAETRLRNLSRRFPGDMDVAFFLANCVSNRAAASIQRMKSLPPAEASKALSQIQDQVKDVEQILKGMEGNQKNADQIALLQGSNFLQLAVIHCQKREWEKAMPWLNRGIDHFRAMDKAGAGNPEFAKRAVLFESQRAQALYEMRKFCEALKAVDQVLEHGGDPEAVGLLRCAILARSGAYREGVAALEKLLAGYQGRPPDYVLKEAACILSAALDGLTRDKSLTEKQKADQARVYAARSVDFLRQSVKAGYKDLDKIRDAGPAGDRDLEPLRGRDEFKDFLRELPAPKSPR